jgi:hypothetical protein
MHLHPIFSPLLPHENPSAAKMERLFDAESFHVMLKSVTGKPKHRCRDRPASLGTAQSLSD